MAKKRDDFYADDERRRPRSRPRDEDDDRPRRRRSRDEDDEEDRPRRRGKKREGLPVGAVVGIVGGVLGLFAVVGVVLWLVLRGDSKGSDDKTGNPTIDQALLSVKAASPNERRQAAQTLAQMQPEDRHRAVVARKLAELQPDPDLFARQSIAGALSLWATPNEVPVLIKYLDDENPFVRTEALKHIGRLRDPRLVAPVIKCFQEFMSRRDAGKALRDMGPMVEKELLPLLVRKERDDVFLRAEVVKVLKDVGTSQSVPGLQAVVAEKNFFLTNEANAALEAIRARGK